MKITRRTFVKGTAATGGLLAASRLLGGGLIPLKAGGSAVEVQPVEDMVHTTCWIGKQDCGILALRVNGRVISLEGDPRILETGALCAPRASAR